MPQVQVIQPIQQQPKRLRVAAYARVSSDSEDQLNSLSVQVDYYTHLIQEKPNWDFAGIYADEGITGTSTKHREQFNRLLDDCRAGLIDRVLVKSASRFARNTADALASVREMKSLGVTVVFEKEGFDTETSNGEMILSMICAVAQEESLSISKNLKWGIRKRMQNGTYTNSSVPFGYSLENHLLVINNQQAMIVADIFKRYLAGESISKIAQYLNNTYPKETGVWQYSSVQLILQNETYKGDTRYQKHYTANLFPTKVSHNRGQVSQYYIAKSHEAIISDEDFDKVQSLLKMKAPHKKNTGQLPQYYIENYHEGIVSKQMFREVQAEIARRNSKSAANQRKHRRGRYNSKYALSERLVCGNCGSPYKRVTWNIHGRKQIVWRCVNRIEYGTKFCGSSPSVPEEKLHRAILKAVQDLAANFTDEVAAQINGILHDIQTGESTKPNLQEQLEQTQQEFDRLLEMSLDFDENTPFLDDKLKKLNNKIKSLKKAIEDSAARQEKASQPEMLLSAKVLQIQEYDDALTARIIEKITVRSRNEIEIRFIGGYKKTMQLI